MTRRKISTAKNCLPSMLTAAVRRGHSALLIAVCWWCLRGGGQVGVRGEPRAPLEFIPSRPLHDAIELKAGLLCLSSTEGFVDIFTPASCTSGSWVKAASVSTGSAPGSESFTMSASPTSSSYFAVLGSGNISIFGRHARSNNSFERGSWGLVHTIAPPQADCQWYNCASR